MFFIWGKSFQMMIFSGNCFFLHTSIRLSWKVGDLEEFAAICIYIYIYIMYINFIIFRALSGNPPKNKQYLYHALKQTISFFSEKVSIPEVSTSKLDGEILGHLPLETLGPCRCPARISALESSCLVLRGKFFWTPVPYAQETTTSATLVTAPAPAPPTST